MKRVLITGANRGIGLELTRQCLARGDRVVACCRKPQLAAELQSLATPNQLSVLELDVAAEPTIDAARERLQADVEALDLLFNNAGANFGGETITNFSAETTMRLIRVNAIGPLLVAQRMRELLRAGSSPKIINISSEAGSIAQMQRFRGYSYYGSKAALNMFTRSLALDKDLEGIIVVALHPGWVQTKMGGRLAPLPVADSVEGIFNVVDHLTPADSGKFLTHEGKEYPW